MREDECQIGMPVRHRDGFNGIISGHIDYTYSEPTIEITRSDARPYNACLSNLSKYRRY